jgi:hypothetical protein
MLFPLTTNCFLIFFGEKADLLLWPLLPEYAD